MKNIRRYAPTFGLTFLLATALLVTATALSQDSILQGVLEAGGIAGQSETILSGGRILRLGGDDAKGGPLATGWVQDPQGGARQLASHLRHARAWHTATVLPNGKVVIIGGLGRSSRTISVIEQFDPDSELFGILPVAGIRARSHHTATLLSDGTVLIVGGTSTNGRTLEDAQLWNPRTGQASAVLSQLKIPRRDHSATLQSDGTVLVHGGKDAKGNQINSDETYDPVLQRFSFAQQNLSFSTDTTANITPELAGTIPKDGATNVSTDTIISLRFSQPMQVDTLSSSTVVLEGPTGSIPTTVVPAEGGMLAFVNPVSQLSPSATYTVNVSGAVGTSGVEMPSATIRFTTGSAKGGGSGGPTNPPAGPNGGGSAAPQVWVPTSDWLTHLPPSRWQSLPPLRAPKGVTALSGQVLTIDGNPLRNVLLQVGQQRALSDSTGRFLITAPQTGKGVLQTGKGLLLIDGTSANSKSTTFGIFEAGVLISPNVTNVLSYVIWMPVLDMTHAITLTSPTTQETVASNPLMPGLELHIPAGTTITDIHGDVVRTISMTPVPLDRPPFPLPVGVNVPIYFTVQPGGAQLWSGSGKWAWAQLIYPNLDHYPPGSKANFWNYDAEGSGWYVYGLGTVSADGKSVVPDPGVGFYEFTGAMQANFGGRSPTGNAGTTGDPIDPTTGIMVREDQDIHIADVIPIDLKRTYLSQDNGNWSFGTGSSDNYDIYLTTTQPFYDAFTLVLANGQQVQYTNTNISNLRSYQDANFVATLSPTPDYYGSTITWQGTCAYNQAGCWDLRLKDGTTWVFPEETELFSVRQAGIRAIIDRYGNTVTIARDSNGNKTQITSPNGRWLQFQHDGNGRINQIQDSMGRTVTYAYDTCASGMLCNVKDVNSGVSSYTYDGSHRMLTATDQLQHTVISNTYDPTSGRVSKQLLADGTSSYQFNYTLSGTQVGQADIFDSNGNHEQKIFDANLFVTTDVRAVSSNVQATYTYTRDPATELVTRMTDPLGRQYIYTYDSETTNGISWTKGNLLSITCSNCLSQSIDESMTYDPVFSQITSFVNPIGKTWNFGRDGYGNLTTITDPLQHSITMSYNNEGQPTSITESPDGVQNLTAILAYTNGNISSVTDPSGNVSRRFTDDAGRTTSLEDALGNFNTYSYDGFDRVTQFTDSLGNSTHFTYDPAENLTQVQDANVNTTTYKYDDRNRMTTRIDPLQKSESYQYDGNGNIIQHTDRRGKITTLQYDELNRLKFVGFGTGTGSGGGGNTYESTITYTWDRGNRVAKAVDSIAGTISRQYSDGTSAYDGLDDVLQETTPQGTVSYSYDNLSRRQTMQVAGQGALSYCWDDGNRLTGIGQQSCSSNPAVGFTYDQANRRSCVTLPNGVVVTYGYDRDSRPTSMTYGTDGSCASPPSNLGNLTYAYDADGRRTSVGGSLASVNLPANVVGGSSTYNADNEQGAFNGATLGYDDAGNLTTDGTNAYTWDGRGHLTEIAQGNTVLATFVYDALGRRINKSVNGTTTQFLYDMMNPVQEIDASDRPTANLLNGLGLDEYFARTDTATSTFLSDALGSTIGMVGASGVISTNYTYEPFGMTTASGVVNGNSFEFSGRENDGTGLYFHRARYYRPLFQRFISQDPLDFRGGDPNLYVYAGNQPTDLIDPSGLSDVVYDASQGVIYIYDGGGNLEGIFPAGNNAQTGSIGPWPGGTYMYSWHAPHSDDASPDSSYGSNGNFVFDVPGCQGCGIHSGRENTPDLRGRTGPAHATNGCIRTTDPGTATLQQLLNEGDPPTTLTVIR